MCIKHGRLICISILYGSLMVLNCSPDPQSEKLKNLLSSINGLETDVPSVAPAPLPGISKTDASGSHSIVAGTPRSIKDGHCGDGIINGTDEDCDQNAIQNKDCSDYGGLAGHVGCHPTTCLYDISDCITPAVNQHIGGKAETCKCHLNSTKCDGGCKSTNAVGQSECDFKCENQNVCACEGTLEAHLESCELRCLCIVDSNGNPACECNLDECEVLVSINPHIANIIASGTAATVAPNK